MAPASSLVLLVVLAGCAGKDLVVGGERPRETSGDEGPDGFGGIDGAVPASDVTLVEDCPLSAENWRERRECWTTTRHVGRWRGFFTGVPRYATTDGRIAEFPTGDVLLELNADSEGRLTFGAPQSGWSTIAMPLVPCDEPGGPPGCDQLGLVIAGFGYHLEDVELSEPEDGPPKVRGEYSSTLPGGMSFGIRLGEPWDAWCAESGRAPNVCTAGDCPGGAPRPAASAAPASSATAVAHEPTGCNCTEVGCEPAAPSFFISLSLSLGDEAVRGGIPSGDSISPARLEFTREPLP